MAQQTAVEILIKKIKLKDKQLYWELSDELEQAKEMEKQQTGYTKEDILKAGEMGEINHHDTKHIISYLDEAKQYNETHQQ